MNRWCDGAEQLEKCLQTVGSADIQKRIRATRRGREKKENKVDIFILKSKF